MDTTVQDQTGAAAAPLPAGGFPGLGNANGVLPPDSTGETGPNHYVQAVNSNWGVFNRSGTKLMSGDINTIWTGFGGACEAQNDGDPVVVYDQIADRWLISQFALPNYPVGPFYQCIAVSKTGDPAGAYHRYQFLMSQSKLNDYPKFGVWSDGYYMSINQYNCSLSGCNWGGAAAVAFERDKMLQGDPGARMIYIDLANVDNNLGGMLPADIEGTALPPAGAPNPFALIDDNAWGYSPDQLQIWDFKANWAAPSSSSFTLKQKTPVAAFDSNMCRYSRNCIPQQGTGVRVDAISDRLMFRLQYRNFGTYQTLVANRTVDAGADRAGIRWYELRNTGGLWTIRQQSTYAPADSQHRWMGSIAMNKSGDIALGFSRSSGTVYPSITVTGRLTDDALNLMTQGDADLRLGSGAQTHSSGRWGDYSHMSVDPLDDCTFWYTQEYYSSTSSANWQTYVRSFRLSDCGTPGTSSPVHVGDLDANATAAKNGWTASVSIVVHDDSHNPVAGAAVTGAWTGGKTGTCNTDVQGKCTVTASFAKRIGGTSFSVTGLTATGKTYAPASNHDPDGDSNGTTIPITRP